MASSIPTTHCKECGCDLFKDGKKELKGALCMKCYYQVIKRKRKSLKCQAVKHAGDKCNDCGESFPDCVYDFHHTQDDKEGCVGNMTHNCRPWDVIKEEVDKCVMLCANCHRIRHFHS